MSHYFITGGTGSLGKALLARLNDDPDASKVTVYSRDEVKQSELRREYSDVRFMLGDVRDFDRLQLAMRGADFVIRAGAYKQVPSAEANVDEAIATNVIGSMNVARAAVLNNVGCVVGVSTDKACQPVNAYGETKALMEKLFQQFCTMDSDTIFNCVRYGNVLGSRGSVVPLFRRQLDDGLPYTLTDPNMTRFWMTLEQAVELVLAPFDDEDFNIEDGAVLVPQCKASTMMVLAQAVDKVWGFDHGEHIGCTITGVRPGEKIHEQLIHANESMHTNQPNQQVPYFQIMPAIEGSHSAPFEYRSDTAAQLSVDELAEMLEASE